MPWLMEHQQQDDDSRFHAATGGTPGWSAWDTLCGLTVTGNGHATPEDLYAAVVATNGQHGHPTITWCPACLAAALHTHLTIIGYYAPDAPLWRMEQPY